MRVAHIMAGAKAGGAELFFERLTAALLTEGDAILPLIRKDPARAARLAATGLHPIQLGFTFGPLTRIRLARHLRAFAPRLVMAWMGRAASMAPRGDWVLAGRLGGTYDLRRFEACDHLVANTRTLAAQIARQGWPAARVHHLPNFSPDLDGAAPANLPVPAGAPCLLAMGRLHRNKAFDVLARALRRLPGVHAVIAGEGPEREPLLRLAAREGVADRFHLLGWRGDQANLLAACTLLACPSRRETLGNVVLEAFSARRAVVAAASDGPRELIEDGRNGLLVPIDDDTALATAIGRVLDDQAVAMRLAAAGRAAFECEHAALPVLTRWRSVMATLAPDAAPRGSARPMSEDA